MIIPCPSGLSIEIRGLSIRDGRFLSDEDLKRDNLVEDRLLESCCTRVVDPGIYKLEHGRLDWGKVLVGDRTVAMIQLRNATYPNDPYEVQMRCPMSNCKKKFDWIITLDRFVEERVQPLPEATRKLMAAGQRCTLTIPGTDRWIKFRPHNADEIRAWNVWRDKMKNGSAKQKERFNDLTHGAVFWGAEIQDIPREDITKKLDFLETLSLPQGLELQKLMNEANCGIEMEIEVRCPYCRSDWMIDLPFDPKTFFAPMTKKVKKDDSGDDTTPSPETTTTTKPSTDTSNPFDLDGNA